jgi:hypothetical protein
MPSLRSVPPGALALLATIFGMPRDFPFQGKPNRQPNTLKNIFSQRLLSRVDILGTVLVLLATLALTAGFEEAGSQFEWRSAFVITLLTLSGVLWIAVLLWEHHVTLSSKIMEPVLPWRFVTNRSMVGLLL